MVSKKWVVHCKRDKFDVLIDRTTKWGNPFIIGRGGTRKEVVEKCKHYHLKHKRLLKEISELKGKVLGCWCAPLRCHGDFLAWYANK